MSDIKKTEPMSKDEAIEFRTYLINRLESDPRVSLDLISRLDTAKDGTWCPPNTAVAYIDTEMMFQQGQFEKIIAIISRLPSDKKTHRAMCRILSSDTKVSYREALSMILQGHDPDDVEVIDGDLTSQPLPRADGHLGETVGDALRLLLTQRSRFDNGLYTIRLKAGGYGRFHIRAQQAYIYERVLSHQRQILLKTRQTGASTLYLLKAFDEATIIPGWEAGLMAQGLPESKKLLERLNLAWDRLPAWWKEALGVTLVSSSVEKISFSSGGTVYARPNFRSQTLTSLHASEVSSYDRLKSNELTTGTFQAVGQGNQIVLESTARGMDNYFFEAWELATERKKELERQGRSLTAADFDPVFLSFVDDPDCHVEPTPDNIADYEQRLTAEIEEYFNKIELELREERGADFALTMGQRIWLVHKLTVDFGGDWEKLHQEYPALPSEAFSASKDGSYYGRIIYQLKERGQITDEVYSPDLDVYVSADLGFNDTMALVFFQVFGSEIRIIDAYGNAGEPISHYCDVMLSKMREYGYRITRLFLPHDAGVKELGTGRDRRYYFQKELGGYGITITTLKRTSSVISDIEVVRKYLPQCWFDKRKTTHLISMLAKYRKVWDEERQTFKATPLHDEASNWADSFRYAILGYSQYRAALGRKRGERGTLSRLNSAQVVDGLAM